MKQFNLPEGDSLVVVGGDTRVSSPVLSTACLVVIAAAGGRAQDIGVVTTPQLHYMVVCINTKQLLTASGMTDSVKLGLVQTAYANDSSIGNSLGVPALRSDLVEAL